MRIGLGIGLPFALGSSLAAQVAALFTQGQQGAWYDPSDFTTLYQDSAGTTPVTAVEQPVGLMKDKSGRGNHASQATAASRPILRQDTNGKYYPAFDGIDDSLSSATGGGGTGGFFWCGAVKPTGGAGTDRTLWSDAGANTGYRVRLTAANKLELSAGNGTPLAPPVQSAATTSTAGGTGLAASTAYYYVITALNAAGESLRSNEVTVTTGLGTTNSNTLAWAASAGAASYTVYRGTAAGAENAFYALGNVLTYVDTGAASTAGSTPTVSETAYTKATSVATVDVGTTSLLTVWDDGTNLNAQIGSGAVASVARPVVAAGTAGFTEGKDNGNGAATGFFTGNLYASVYRQAVPSATERTQVQAYIRSQAGL